MPGKRAPARGRSLRRGIAGIAVAAAVVCAAASQSAWAYIGASYLSIPGVKGGARESQFRNWLRIESHYWQNDDFNPFGRRGIGGMRRGRNFFSGPVAPQKGAQGLVIAVDKRSPMLGEMMARCKSQTVIPQMTFAESSNLARSPIEIGKRPESMPEWFQYRLSSAKITDCPVVAEAPEQAFVIDYQDIGWLNYSGPAEGQTITLQPAALVATPLSGATKTFVVSWFGVANDVADDQCARFNPKPSEADYYALMTPEQAARERIENAKKGGVGYEDGQMEWRGPNRLNAVKLPGIVKDPGILVPRSKFARGLDLDRNDGTGRVPAGTCRHDNYESQDRPQGHRQPAVHRPGLLHRLAGPQGFLLPVCQRAAPQRPDQRAHLDQRHRRRAQRRRDLRHLSLQQGPDGEER